VAPLVDDWASRLVLGGVKSNGLVKISAANISDGMAWEGVRLWRDMAWLIWFCTCFVDRENANCEENIKGFYRGMEKPLFYYFRKMFGER